MEKILNDKILYKGNTFTVKELSIEVQPGQVVKWEVVDKGGNSVAMVPIDNQGNVYLVKEYFGAINRRILSLPKGMVNKGETYSEAAQRELQEEIGMKGKLKKIAEMDLSPSYLNQKTILFLVTDLKPSKLEPDEKEYLKEVKIPMSEAINKIIKGEITEARTIGGIILAKTLLGL